MQTDEVKDQWDEKLDNQLVVIKECQIQHNVQSCMKCDKVLNCDIKDTYVKTVYESMNKGSGGGFEF
jgi:hypothetical protein